MKLPIGIEDFAMLRQNNYYFVVEPPPLIEVGDS